MDRYGTYTILPLEWRSHNIWVSDWIALFTLGLAPLMMHILSGAPRPSYLACTHPKWHDRLCLFIPTSILWRYAAITDRRIRTRSWNSSHMAASNAIFWTDQGWDGSEAMVERSLPYVIYLPEKAQVELFSLESIKTTIILLQGIQAMAVVIGNLASTGDYTTMDTVSGLFIPMAMCGMLRLCAAPWLTDNFIYAERRGLEEGETSEDASFKKRWTMDSLIDVIDTPDLHPRVSQGRLWASRIFRFLYMLPILGFWMLDFLFITPWVGTFGWVGVWTTTSWMLGVYYMAFLVPTIMILSYYFSRGPIRTTIIPCISTWWYKAYSILMAAFTVALITVAAIETRKTVCGKYTTLGSQYGDPCATGDGARVLDVQADSTGMFGIAQSSGNSGIFTVANFTGSCLGVLGPDSGLYITNT